MHFSSSKHDWETPDSLFAKLDREFHFTLDGAASPQNAKCPRFYCEEHWYRSQPRVDFLRAGLSSLRGETIFLNPPYGRELGAWVHAAARAGSYGATAVMLIPSRTDTAYWHDFIWDDVRHEPRPGVEARFLCGRVKFKGAKSGAPFPSAVVVFHAG